MAIYYNGHLQSTKGGGGSSGGGGIDYSTTEQDTGLKWVDDKPIYQKTFNTSINSSIDITALNIDNITEYKGMWRATNGSQYGLDCFAYAEYKSRMIFNASNTSMYLSVEGWTFASGFVTIFYTKTTDTV